jgi:uncharacterized protein YbbC (DUF1343 family)
MSIKRNSIFIIVILINHFVGTAQTSNLKLVEYSEITTGASQFDKYTKQLTGKNVAIIANQASIIGDTHLVDTLLSQGINITKIFCPEHGFRGTADAGKKIDDNIDPKTNIPIISLYGSHKEPTSNDLDDVDIVLFDLQDVGTRFYTYISTLTYVMDACAKNNIPIIVLDRPNPNAYYIDGPVLEMEHTSFVGLHPVPVVYGMTIGEYALMVAGEKWITEPDKLDLQVIPLKNWSHNTIVKLKTKPSPNLPNWQSVFLYPSLCFFEGTEMSIGRGTEYPFQIFGHPNYLIGSYTFTPESTQGATNPKYKNQKCFGANLADVPNQYNSLPQQLNLFWLINSYKVMNDSSDFFNNYFVKLAGTDELQKQIENGLTEVEIRKSWQPKLDDFRKTRSKYLLYP